MVSVILDGKAMGSIYRKGMARTENVREMTREIVFSIPQCEKSHALIWAFPGPLPGVLCSSLAQNKTTLSGLYGGGICGLMSVMIDPWDVVKRGNSPTYFSGESYLEGLALSVGERGVLM